MKKKIVPLLLVTALTTSLCACSTGEKEDKKDSISISVEQTDPSQTEETDNGLDFDVEEQVLIDANGIRITATGPGINEYTGDYSLDLTVDNTTDTDLTIGFRSPDVSLSIGEGTYTYLNGFQVSSSAYIAVPAQSTAEDTCTLSKAVLDNAGITQIGEIELAFSATDANYNECLDESQSICTVRTTLESEMDTQLSEDLQLVYDQNGIQIHAKYLPGETEDDKGCLIAVIRNNTGAGAQLRIKDVTVDGTPLTYSYSPDEDAFRYSIGGYYYENNGKAVCTATSFNAADTVPEITGSSSISFSLDIGGPASGDWSGMKTIGPLSVPI